jgi:hypothetical protein
MLSIENTQMMVSCEENGTRLALSDKKRGTRWLLDPKSLGHSSPPHNIWGRLDSELKPMIPASARVDSPATLRVMYQAGEAWVEIIYEMQDGFVDVQLPAPLSDDIGAVTLPGSFSPEGETLKLLLPIMQGMLWNGQGPAFSHIRGDGVHTGFSMAFAGFLGESGGLLLTAESQDDCRWWFGKSESQRMWTTNLQIASLGTMRYERAVRLYVTDADIVAIAKQYRQKVIQQGRFKNWEQKIAERPALERIFGALMCFIGYCEDDVDYVASCRKLKTFGFERALLYPSSFNVYDPNIRMGGVPAINLSRDTIEAIKALGYDIAPWSWLNEALPSSSGEVTHMLRRDSQGNPVPHWKIDDQHWDLMCYSYIQDYQRRALGSSIDNVTWDHFDVLSCVSPMECYALNHPRHMGRPAARSEDRQWVRDTFLADQQAGRMVSSESFNDAYSVEYDFGSVKAWPQYGPWPFWPVPLTMLVYHDSVVHSWWEVHSYNNGWRGRANSLFEYGGGRPRLMAALDALMGCPPDVFPFGTQYGYTGHGTDTFLYKYRFEDAEVQIALKTALPVAKLHQRIGRQEMVHFKILSDDGYVQESAFADGTRVVANFGLDFVGDVPGVDHRVVNGAGLLEPEGWRVAE